MNWLKKFGSLCLAVVLSVCLVAQVGSALADDKKVTSVEVETMPNKTVYVIGEEFSAEGGTLKVTYDDGTTEIVAMTDSGVKLSKPHDEDREHQERDRDGRQKARRVQD